jgi:hypothetical protein
MLTLAVLALVIEPAEVLVVESSPVSEFRDQVITALWALAIPTAIGFVAFVRYASEKILKMGRQWVDSWSLSRELEARDIRWRAAMDRVEAAAVAGMEAAEQTIVRHLRAAEPVGKLDAVQSTAAMTEALAAAQSHFGPSMWAETAAALELDGHKVMALVQTKIEAALGRTKGAKPIGDAGSIVSVSAADASTVRVTIDGLEPGDSGPAGQSQR